MLTRELCCTSNIDGNRFSRYTYLNFQKKIKSSSLATSLQDFNSPKHAVAHRCPLLLHGFGCLRLPLQSRDCGCLGCKIAVGQGKLLSELHILALDLHHVSIFGSPAVLQLLSQFF
jgi:hypothetical protein